ncbi:MAG: hypothetical protein VXW65_03325 [Pseudomonadota bacterium]|nr:hypothetical protein [Pseudomonadota bacterium]
MQYSLPLNHDELSSIPCDTFKGDAARSKAIELGLAEVVDVIPEAIQDANNSLALKTYFNPSRPIARWGDICEQACLRLLSGGWKQKKIHGQPCLINQAGNIQIIFMSPNDALCDEMGIISSSYPKGIATELKLLANKCHYSEQKFIRTFIVYYQPCSQIDNMDSNTIPFEIAYAVGIHRIKESREKSKCYPTNHTLRLMFSEPHSDLESYQAPQSGGDDDITEADFSDLVAV